MLRQCGDTTVAAMQYTQLAGKAQQRVTSCSGSVATQQWQFDAVIDSKSNNKNPLTVSGHVCTLKKLSQVCTGQGRFPENDGRPRRQRALPGNLNCTQYSNNNNNNNNNNNYNIYMPP